MMAHNLLRYFQIILHNVLSHCTLMEGDASAGSPLWMTRKGQLTCSYTRLTVTEGLKGEKSLLYPLHCAAQGTVLLRSIISHWQKAMKARNVMASNRWLRAAEQGLISQGHIGHHTGNQKIRQNMLSLRNPERNLSGSSETWQKNGKGSRVLKSRCEHLYVTWSGERDMDHRAPSWASTVSSRVPEAKSYSCSRPVCGRQKAQRWGALPPPRSYTAATAWKWTPRPCSAFLPESTQWTPADVWS